MTICRRKTANATTSLLVSLFLSLSLCSALSLFFASAAPLSLFFFFFFFFFFFSLPPRESRKPQEEEEKRGGERRKKVEKDKIFWRDISKCRKRYLTHIRNKLFQNEEKNNTLQRLPRSSNVFSTNTQLLPPGVLKSCVIPFFFLFLFLSGKGGKMNI